ncbi:acetyltransferase-like isoleucine patch superfamily enzyme [Ensifer adhaerens]|uniref:Acetyltransferase-like isoleucine patch superfamily enzyme n=1 Tax=Ensifer adhaerens TaxID=106592 RepID=A0ACC5STP6_ENSAD|nr:acyltransferase [Ensifer adhaerens]MBP1872271.1 acetyltransferase-like isoleucine patch superfamily enzyme [Ensifer adhaerens]
MPIADTVVLGENVVIYHPDLANLYGCTIGDGTRIGTFVEIQSDVEIGANCKIQSHCFICSGVTIEDGVFVGHGVMFTNDRYPRAINEDGRLQSAADWTCLPTRVSKGASIGSNATILPDLVIGQYALVAAGAVVTRSVPAHAIVAGNPARIVGSTSPSQRTSA